MSIKITPDDLAYAVRRAREETSSGHTALVANTAQTFLAWQYEWSAIDTPSTDLALRNEIARQSTLLKG